MIKKSLNIRIAYIFSFVSFITLILSNNQVSFGHKIKIIGYCGSVNWMFLSPE